MAQEQQADTHLSFHVPWIAAVGEDLLNVVPGCRLDLEDAPGAGARREVRLMAGLHPGERASEPSIDAVMARPAVDLSADLRLCPQAGKPAARSPESRDRVGSGHAVGLQSGAALNPEHSSVRHRPEDAVERDEHAVSAQQELELGNVPAPQAAQQHAVSELMPSPATELGPRSWARHTVGNQVVTVLEAPDPPPGLRADEPVERTAVVAALEQRELQSRNVRRGRPRWRRGGE